MYNAQRPYQRNISAKIQKNIQKSEYLDGFCLQGELDLTLFVCKGITKMSLVLSWVSST